MKKIFNQIKDYYIESEFVLYIISLSMLIFSIIFQNPEEILIGFKDIIVNPSNLLTDYMYIGGVGAAFFNSFTIFIYSIIVSKILKVEISGAEVAAIILVSGFAFFGTNIFNSLPLTFGVILYGKIEKQNLKSVILPALYISALGPLVSEISLVFISNRYIGVIVGYIIGIFIGFITMPLATSFLRFHKGYNLYNIGFTAGIIGMMVVGLMRMIDLEVKPVSNLYLEDNIYVKIYILSLSLFLIIYGFIRNGFSFKGLKKLLSRTGRLPSDFVVLDGLYPTLINMGLVGIIASIYVILIGGVFNGPVLGGILSVIAFGAFGKHVKNILPILIGVYIASLLNIHEPSSTSAILAGLFGTTLAPIAGEYGILSGIIAGFLHMAMVFNIGIVHGGMNLYNNGFSGGFIAGIMIPLLENYKRIMEERKEDNS